MTTTKTYTETITEFAVTEVAPAMEDYRSGRGIESTVDAQVHASEIAREFGKDEKEVWKEAVAIAKNDNTFTTTTKTYEEMINEAAKKLEFAERTTNASMYDSRMNRAIGFCWAIASMFDRTPEDVEAEAWRKVVL